ncbi:vasorin [Kryptolebias marmoratus]|uniref:Vasorin n=1 Tax=Kryptolebias marmoratus TaxID=37003 RepID=A0A3Q3ABR1_KRYMA|nr:vasorin [Kryptolebias marmoratus]XP_017264549.1 vasorin [Kryptolebias marmoratus]
MMLLYLMFFLLISAVELSIDCPELCTCNAPDSIFCINRRSSTVPQVPVTTQHLYIFQNNILTLSQDDFKDLKELVTLDLSQNELAEIPDRVFESLSKLKNLDISANSITHISKDSFFGLVQLERLYLYGNRIQSIHWEAFEGLEMLLELKLRGNQLTSLPSLNFPRLLLLDLSHNNIPTLGPSDLHTPNLEALQLVSLGLTSVDEDVITSLRNLHELDLSGNKLNEVPQALRQDSLKGLIKLSLASNPLLELRVEDFQKLVGLQELDLSGLNLQGFSEGFFKSFPKLMHLAVAENPFNCQCPLAWFPAWLKEKKVNLKGPEITRCHFPLVNAGKMLSELEHKDFGCPPTTTEYAGSPKENTLVPQIPTTPPDTIHTKAILPPLPTSEETITLITDSYPILSEDPVSPSSNNEKNEQHFCPPNICLNGATCTLDSLGFVSCLCPSGIFGLFCENEKESAEPRQPSTTEVSSVAPAMPNKPDAITSLHVTSTSILLDLHRFIETRPNIRGIRLTYRNLSGPDRRPILLSLPTSYPEYTLRGLKPNCTYLVCASPLGEKSIFKGNSSIETGSCTEARTEEVPVMSVQPRVNSNTSITSTLITALIVLALVLGLAVVVGTLICLGRKKWANTGMELELGPADPDPTELDGIKSCLDNGVNGTLPLKQPETDYCQTSQLPPLLKQNGGLDYETPLMQEQCSSNNNLASLKPSYF